MLSRLISALLFTLLMAFAVSGITMPGVAAMLAHGDGAALEGSHENRAEGLAVLDGLNCRLHHLVLCHVDCQALFLRQAGQRNLASSKKRIGISRPVLAGDRALFAAPALERFPVTSLSLYARFRSPYAGYRARTGRQLN